VLTGDLVAAQAVPPALCPVHTGQGTGTAGSVMDAVHWSCAAARNGIDGNEVLLRLYPAPLQLINRSVAFNTRDFKYPPTFKIQRVNEALNQKAVGLKKLLQQQQQQI